MADEKTTEEINNEDEVRVVYEAGFLLLPNLSDEELNAKIDSFKAIISESDAEYISEGSPKMQPLAYVMDNKTTTSKDKYDHAYFAWIKFCSTVEVMEKIKSTLTSDNTVIRFLLIKTSREDTLAKPVRRRATPAKESPKKDVSEPKKKEEKEEDNSRPLPDDIDKSIDELIVT